MLTIPRRVLRQYAQEQGIHEMVATNHFQELAWFLEVCASTDARCAPSPKVDGVWHCFLQFTREYREFCVANFGFMIDHDPSPREENVRAYLCTRELAVQKFGTLQPDFWPAGDIGATCCGAKRCAL